MVEWNLLKLEEVIDIMQDFADEVVSKKDGFWVQSIVACILLPSYGCFRRRSDWSLGVSLAHADYFSDDHLPDLLAADGVAELRKAKLLINLKDLIVHFININLIELRRKEVIDLLEAMVID